MIWVGLTGGIATGKSTVVGLIVKIGYPVVDADELAHQALQICHGAVVEEFGEVVSKEGVIDRKVLGGIVFGDRDKLSALERLVHPVVRSLSDYRREALVKEHDLAFYDVPLLFENDMRSNFDCTVLVYACADLQRHRLRERDCLSDEEIGARLASQLPIDDKKGLADYVIDNQGSVMDLGGNVSEFLHALQRKYFNV